MSLRRFLFHGIVGCFLPLTLAAAESPAGVTFTDITTQSKLDFTYRNSATSNKYLIETMGGGVGLLDFDDDKRREAR